MGIERATDKQIYGLTGEVGRDGLLSLEQQSLLNHIQRVAANACHVYLESRKPREPFPMVAMATGIGKSKVIHEVIATQKAIKPDSKILVIAGTKLILVDQTEELLQSYQQANSYQNGIEIDVVNQDQIDPFALDQESFLGYSVGRYGDQAVEVQIVTMQTIQNAYKHGALNASSYDLVIVDEVHNAGTHKRNDIIKRFSRVVGFTATPHRYTGDLLAPEHYGFKVIFSFTLPETQQLELLPPLYALQVNTTSVVDKVPTTLTGKIDFKELEKVLKYSKELRPYLVDKIAPIITYGNKEYKTVITVNYVWEAQEIAELLVAKGIRVGLAINYTAAKALHSDNIPTLNTIARYSLPQTHPESIQVLISPYVASEGFNAPFTEILVWASPTDSHLRYTQYTGRLARRAEGKSYGVVIDCLYQTSQYQWLYNFGMWMKGHVQRLPSGILYLGPGAKDQRDVEQMAKLADHVSLAELQRESGILEVQEGELPIIQKSLANLFTTDWPKIKPMIQNVMKKLLEKDPEEYATLFQKRRNGSHVFTAATNPQKFIELMVAEGANSKEKTEEIKKGELAIVQSSLRSVFVGVYKPIQELSLEIMSHTREKDIHKFHRLFVRRRNGNTTVWACKNPEWFISQMVERGVRRKEELLEIQPGDFPITHRCLSEIFVGTWRKAGNLSPLAKKIIEKLKTGSSEERELLVKRKNKGWAVWVCTNREMVIKIALEQGAKPKPNHIPHLSPKELCLGARSLRKIFIGSAQTFKDLVQGVKEKIAKEHTEEYSALFQTRRSGNNIIEVCTDKERFIQMAIEESGTLRETISLGIQKSELSLALSNLHTMFHGNWTQLRYLRERAKAAIKNSDPQSYQRVFVLRRSGNWTIEVCIDPALFIDWMHKVGARPR